MKLKSMSQSAQRIRWCVLILMIFGCVLAWPQAVKAETDPEADLGFSVTKVGEEGEDRYTYEEGVLTILHGAEVRIKNKDPNKATSHRIVVAKNATAAITLEGVKIDVYNIPDACALALEEGAQVSLALSGSNYLASNYSRAGLCVPEKAALTVHCGNHGTLEASGGYDGAGIGGVVVGEDGGNVGITTCRRKQARENKNLADTHSKDSKRCAESPGGPPG